MEEPLIFLKAGSAITYEENPIILPFFSKEGLYEIKVSLQFNTKLEVEWVGLALDLTTLRINSRNNFDQLIPNEKSKAAF